MYICTVLCDGCALISQGLIFMVFTDWKPSTNVYVHENSHRSGSSAMAKTWPSTNLKT